MHAHHVICGHYRVIETLGSGGMGNVYRAEDAVDGTVWAIKEMSPSPENENEARLLLRLNHPSLVTCRELIEESGFLYLVMEYIEGMTLQRCLESSGALVEELALDWCSQICDVLVYLHGLPKAVIYRDLKPSNIMVQPDKKLRVIDFGIAGEYTGRLSGDAKVKALTKGYAAPEQYSGSYAEDARTDIYALGAVLHYMLTGKSPLDPPYRFAPVRRLRKDVSYGAQAICMRCLQTNPDDRYQSAQELADALAHVDNLSDQMAETARKKHRVLSGALVVVLAALIGIFLFAREQRIADHATYDQLVSTAQELVDEQKYEAAEDSLRKAISLDPNDATAYIAMARIYLDEGDTDLCSQYIELNILSRFDGIADNDAFAQLVADLNALKEEQES